MFTNIYCKLISYGTVFPCVGNEIIHHWKDRNNQTFQVLFGNFLQKTVLESKNALNIYILIYDIYIVIYWNYAILEITLQNLNKQKTIKYTYINYKYTYWITTITQYFKL